MSLTLGHELCNRLDTASSREWLVTNGIGGYASGTITGLLTRRYHGLLVAALNPPLARTLLVTKLDETAQYAKQIFPLFTNRWADGTIDPHGYQNILAFHLEGTTPVWQYILGNALLEKRIWMTHGANTTYIRYTLVRATAPLTLNINAFVNYRDYHAVTQAGAWQMDIRPVENGLCIQAFREAIPFYLRADQGQINPVHEWYFHFDLAQERERGLEFQEDHLLAGTFTAQLRSGESMTFMATTDAAAKLNGQAEYKLRRLQEEKILARWQDTSLNLARTAPAWIKHLSLAADQFIVERPLKNQIHGKTIIAGYHWFTDWGRDTMISLPGLCLTTGRPDIARLILSTFADYADQGMLPNRFTDNNKASEYISVDAAFWYFEAIRQYYELTKDKKLLNNLFPLLDEIIRWHIGGTRYNIHVDPNDGLLYAGEKGIPLTWMDAKIGDWVVTPRAGKPVEVNALWYNALKIMVQFARALKKPSGDYTAAAQKTLKGFSRFFSEELGYCYDCLNEQQGHDGALRPNQILAVSLPESPLTLDQQRRVLETCADHLLTPYGLRTLAPNHPQYRGHYGGNAHERDGSYHQGVSWGWLLGPFVLAHLKVYQNPAQAQEFLKPMADQILNYGVGTLGEIFDGNAPYSARGCVAQAWTVAEILRAWSITEKMKSTAKQSLPGNDPSPSRPLK